MVDCLDNHISQSQSRIINPCTLIWWQCKHFLSAGLSVLTEFISWSSNSSKISHLARTSCPKSLFYAVMVFVFHQMLVSALLYLSNKLKALAFNVSGEEKKRGVYLTDETQVISWTWWSFAKSLGYLTWTVNNFILSLTVAFSKKLCKWSLFAFYAKQCLQVTLWTITSVFIAECPYRSLQCERPFVFHGFSW